MGHKLHSVFHQVFSSELTLWTAPHIFGQAFLMNFSNLHKHNIKMHFLVDNIFCVMITHIKVNEVDTWLSFMMFLLQIRNENWLSIAKANIDALFEKYGLKAGQLSR